MSVEDVSVRLLSVFVRLLSFDDLCAEGLITIVFGG